VSPNVQIFPGSIWLVSLLDKGGMGSSHEAGLELLIVCVCVCVCVCVSIPHSCLVPEEGIGFTGTGVTDHCELPGGAGDLAPLLWKSSQCLYS